jgi:DHA1 family bicyclomycin/chloramphenicol resistance-like MFS transporter
LTTRPSSDPGLAVRAEAPLGLILLLGSLTAIGPLSIDMYLPGLPELGRSLGVSPAASQQTVSVFFIGLAFGQLLYGPLSDRLGRRGPLLVGLGLYLAGTIGCALAPSIEVLLACRAVQAVGGSCGGVIARAVVRDRFPPNQMLHVFSLLMLVLGVSPIFAPLVGGWVLLVGSWRSIFWVQAVFGAVLVVAVALRLQESRSAETAAHARTENAARSYLGLLRERLIWAYMLTGACSGAALLTYIASSPDVLIGAYHVRPQDYGYVFGVNGLGLIVCTQINARLARRWPSDLVLQRILIIDLVCALALLAATITGFGGLWGVLIPLFLVVSCHGFTQPNATNGAMAVDARRAGATAALTGCFSFAVGSLAAAIAGALHDGTARPMAAVIVVGLVIALISLKVLGPPIGRRPA